MNPIVEATGVAKAFGGVQALKGVSLSFLPGEVHGLIGANGAGKSTFVRILAGVHQPDAGEILIDGEPRHIRHPLDARDLGLSFIHQELNLVPKFTVLQNLALGLKVPSHFGITDWQAFRSQAEPIAERLRFPFALGDRVEDLTVADRWLVSIGHALIHEARLIAMDEPTASLSVDEVERLFEIIRDLTSQGVSVIYVSHRLDEVEAICDRVSIFRDGAHVKTIERASVSRQVLIEGIIGGPMPEPVRGTRLGTSLEPVLELRGMTREPAVRGVSLSVGRSEVVGLAGLVGAGRTEVVRLVFGADRPQSGTILLEGRPIEVRSPGQASRAGIALVPEERRTQGLLLRESVSFNLNLASLADLRLVAGLPFISPRRGDERARTIVDRLQVKTPDVATEVGRLSGGNQQKVVVGKWLHKRPKLLILDEPTRGVDVGARAEIHRTIRSLADEGMAILMVASELEELLGCDRVLVMRDGRVEGELVGGQISLAAMLTLCYGGHSAAA